MIVLNGRKILGSSNEGENPMKKDQLSREIEEKFEQESNKVINNVEDKEKHSKLLTIIISVIMSGVILGSLVYSLLESIGKWQYLLALFLILKDEDEHNGGRVWSDEEQSIKCL